MLIKNRGNVNSKRGIMLSNSLRFTNRDEINNSCSMMYNDHTASRNLQYISPEFATRQVSIFLGKDLFFT